MMYTFWGWSGPFSREKLTRGLSPPGNRLRTTRPWAGPILSKKGPGRHGLF